MFINKIYIFKEIQGFNSMKFLSKIAGKGKKVSGIVVKKFRKCQENEELILSGH